MTGSTTGKQKLFIKDESEDSGWRLATQEERAIYDALPSDDEDD